MAISTQPPLIVASGITVVGGLSLALAVTFITGRLLSNAAMFHRLFRDDFACVFGGLLFVAYTGVCIGIYYFSKHDLQSSTDVTDPTYLKLIYNAELLYALTSVAAKLSILLLYLRIFSPSNQLRRSIYLASAAVVLLYLASITVFSYFCAPNAEQTIWVPQMANVCSTANPFALVQSVLNAGLNLFILVLPIPSIMRLHLTLKKRLGIAFILMHGVFALVASGIAVYFRIGLLKARDSSSTLWWRTVALECGTVELGMTLVSSSLHACWAYLRSAHSRRRAKSLASETTMTGHSRHRRSTQHPTTAVSTRTLHGKDVGEGSAGGIKEPEVCVRGVSPGDISPGLEGGEMAGFDGCISPIFDGHGSPRFNVHAPPRMTAEPMGGINVQTEMTMWVELARAERGGRDSMFT